ncbi:MAG: phosphoglycerate kinase [Candidatus Portnoybacteria bacterium]|nr:phosphoglycerate kinase [Candidatus Portnoybacteria bacterium]
MKPIRDIDVSDKRVLVRVDFNVSLDKQGNVVDDFRIKAVLPTIEYLIENHAKVILMSHLGKPNGRVVENLRLDPVREKLAQYLNLPIVKTQDCIGEAVVEQVLKLSAGKVLLLENLRFHKEEEENDDKFARELARLGEIYVNDAFAVSHREHASVAAVVKHLPAYAGLILEKEIRILSEVFENPPRSLVVIIGGAKISTKIKLIKCFLGFADNILLGGALANTVLHAQGLAIGKSLIEEEMVGEVKSLQLTDTKMHIPVDTVVSADKTGNGEISVAPVGKIGDDELILDIGPETEKLFSEVIKNAKTVVWNGPMGLFEVEQFEHGTDAVARAIISCSCHSVVGGGETTAFLAKRDWFDKFFHVSTGGGAMLEFLAGEKLPGIAALEK